MIHLPTRLDLFRALPPGSIGAEIGVLRGDFSREILSLPNIAHLHMVDAWRRRGGAYATDPADNQDHEANMRQAEAVAAAHPGRATVHRREADEWMVGMVGQLDFFYLDADHTEPAVYLQLLRAANALKPGGGTILGHDYRVCPKSIQMGFGVVEAVSMFLAYHNDWKLTTLTLDEWPSYRLERVS